MSTTTYLRYGSLTQTHADDHGRAVAEIRAYTATGQARLIALTEGELIRMIGLAAAALDHAQRSRERVDREWRERQPRRDPRHSCSDCRDGTCTR